MGWKHQNRTLFYETLTTGSWNYRTDFAQTFALFIVQINTVMACRRTRFGDMRCLFIPDSLNKEWTQVYNMDSPILTLFTTSIASNGDVWLSGGISLTYETGFAAGPKTFSVVNKINVINHNTFTMDNVMELPKTLAGHCQVPVSNEQVFIYGGISSITLNETFDGQVKQTLTYSNEAFLWVNETWLSIMNENPCSNNGQDLAFQQPCTKRILLNQTQIIIITFGNKNSCTSILNLNTHGWIIIDDTEVSIPIGGHLVTSLDKTRVFYLGGLYYSPEEKQSLDVYELSSNGWLLTQAKLPFGISSNETKSYPSLHNVTLT